MSFILNAASVRRSAPATAQVAQRELLRRTGFNVNRHHSQMVGNALPDLDPRAWLDLDTRTVELLNQAIDPLFSDLMPLSRSVNIGKLVAAYKRVGAMDQGESSLTGQTTHLMGELASDYDGIVIPIHAKGFGKQWRELEGKRSIGADDIAENQAAAMREVMRLMLVNFVDGNEDINYQGADSFGIKTNPNTIAITLEVDLTSKSATYAEIQPQIVAILQAIRGGRNRVTAKVKLYISAEIEANLMRSTGGTTQDRTFMAALLADTPGLEAIEASDSLNGNEVIGIVRSSQFIEPVTGMAPTTTPIPRLAPFADWQWLCWSASALLIKADQSGRAGVVYGAPK